VGTGGVDAVAALTWDVPENSGANPAAVREVVAPPAPPVEDTKPRNIALIGTAVLALVALVAVRTYRRKDPIT
jgi:membrane-anchored mycosin MYCP